MNAARDLRRIRIAVQLACLALFLFLLLRTVGVGENRLGSPVRIFLEIDPLIGLTTWLRTRALPGLLWLSGITLAAAFLLGRSFCGWICPLGTLSQASGRLFRRRSEEKTADRWRPFQRWKYLLLAFVLVSAALGSLWSGLFDPLCILIRGLAVGLGPAAEAVVRGASRTAASTPLGPVTDPAWRVLRDSVLASRAPLFQQGFVLALVLLAILASSWALRRFWCRGLCPLGALLGTVAKGGPLLLRQDGGRCTSCGICSFHCQGAAEPDRIGGWRPEECYVCGNCTAACARGGLSFGFERPRIGAAFSPGSLRRGSKAGGSRRSAESGEAAVESAASPAQPAAVAAGPVRSGPPDWTRRKLLLAGALGAIAAPLGRVSPSRAHPAGGLIRPPGAGAEQDFLDRCVRCGECMKVCPGNGLHPVGLEAGPLALWTPVLRARDGYCEYECTLCGQVCPTGALARLDQATKKKTVIGLAWLDVSRCLPYAYATPCIVCEEHCPTSPKAVWLEDATVRTPAGETRAVRRPRIDPALCVGCGICEYRCPMEGEAAIRITATGRTGRGGPFELGAGSMGYG